MVCVTGKRRARWKGKQNNNVWLGKWTQTLKLRKISKKRKRQSGVHHQPASSADSSLNAGGSPAGRLGLSTPGCAKCTHIPTGVAGGGCGDQGAEPRRGRSSCLAACTTTLALALGAPLPAEVGRERQASAVQRGAESKGVPVVFRAALLPAETSSSPVCGFIGGMEKKSNSKIQPKRAHQERKNLPIFTLSRLLNNTRLLIWLLSLH